MMSARHFLSLMDCTPEELVSVIRRGVELKDLRNRGVLFEPLKNRVLGMIFEKSSTRTRLSFEAGMIQLGGQAIFLSPRDTQLGRGEPIGDAAIVMSSMLDAVMIRTFSHSTLTEFAANSRVPLINGLSDDLRAPRVVLRITGQKPTASAPSPPRLIAKLHRAGVQMLGCCQETGFKSATAVIP